MNPEGIVGPFQESANLSSTTVADFCIHLPPEAGCDGRRNRPATSIHASVLGRISRSRHNVDRCECSTGILH
ncbi:unnamed protein product [Bursaphelenchus okinawaensis]|uniref:Uncharacterized protein n=1 Tax=Bursaphelenchus okinawaensis TaxID=465554 RepID=A0A811L4K8_9BILA|nr:unnamed protein product [Bursaphelenchus okinawaensis]CAG9119590.1 unnamed protein product [Bursaphelenchus okinawaensis]